MIATNKLIGPGLYTPEEAALYARIHTKTLNRWLYGDGSGAAVFMPERGRDNRHVSFLDFVQALAIRAITTMATPQKVPLPKIRKALEEARNQYGVEYPFAMAHKTYLFGSDVIIEVGDDDYRPLTGKSRGNKMFTTVVELYMKKLSFDAEGLAIEYLAWGAQGSDYAITMNPKRRFGEPMFAKSGYTAHTLWQAVASEGSIEAVSKAYDVPPTEVETACDYFDHLQATASA